MLGTMSLLSRFSRWRGKHAARVILDALPKGLKIAAGIADAGYKQDD